MADIKGFQYSRKDVKARFIATEFSTVLGDLFVRQPVPMEVEIMVAEIGNTSAEDRMYFIPFYGGLVEERGLSVIGDYIKTEENVSRKGLIGRFIAELDPTPNISLSDAAKLCNKAVTSVRQTEISPERIEMIVLDRTLKSERKFKRLSVEEIIGLLK